MSHTAPISHEQEKAVAQKEVFYSPATEAMIAARKVIAAKSFKVAHERVLHERKFHDDDAYLAECDNKLRELFMVSKEMTLNSSQIGDDRPLTSIRSSPFGSIESGNSFVASGSLSGTVKIWNSSNLSCVSVLRRHGDRVTSVAWNGRPWDTDEEASNRKILLASTSADGICNIWNSSKACDTNAGNQEENENDDDDVEEEGGGGNYYGMPEDEGNGAMEVESKDHSEKTRGQSEKSILLHQLKGHNGIVTSWLTDLIIAIKIFTNYHAFICSFITLYEFVPLDIC